MTYSNAHTELYMVATKTFLLLDCSCSQAEYLNDAKQYAAKTHKFCL